jgi:hypothetical protein
VDTSVERMNDNGTPVRHRRSGLLAACAITLYCGADAFRVMLSPGPLLERNSLHGIREVGSPSKGFPNRSLRGVVGADS